MTKRLVLLISICVSLALHGQTVKSVLKATETILIPENGPAVTETVAHELLDLAPQAHIKTVTELPHRPPPAQIVIAIAGSEFSHFPFSAPSEDEWMAFSLHESGAGYLVVSSKHLLYALFCQIREEWLHLPADRFRSGTVITPAFLHITGEDGFYGRRRRFCLGYDPESTVKALARMGCSHIIVNALATRYPKEQGPAGEIYYRFYQFAPDLDQYVETELNRGTYSPEYLKANRSFLKQQARLAEKYGLTPGMHIANPRSCPESFFDKFPFLRGARVDHTFRSFEPRYTMSTAHPLVRWHYAHMMQKLLTEVPQIGFISTLINDSGAGFEYTASLYPGRNGGPYIVREWRPDDVIAEKAARNVIRYYKTLRDAAREINPDFRIILTLKNIAEEAEIILGEMDEGIDWVSRTQRSDARSLSDRKKDLQERGSFLYTNTSINGSAYIPGVPAPWQALDALSVARDRDFLRIDLNLSPASIAPYDINREVARAFHLSLINKVDSVVFKKAREWVGNRYAASLATIWRFSDEAVRAAPSVPLYERSGFTWYRAWDRPLVPNIDKIPHEERAYYEDYLLAIFNNPNRIDLNRDALWSLFTVAQCDSILHRFDRAVWRPLDRGISLADSMCRNTDSGSREHAVFADMRDRLSAYKSYLTTLRNITAWIGGVHGYMQSDNAGEKEKRRQQLDEMMDQEIANMKALTTLWERSSIIFMPVYASGENGHDYGPDFGEKIERKIDLMQRYRHHEPHVDADFIWRLPSGCPVSVEPEEYLKY